MFENSSPVLQEAQRITWLLGCHRQQTPHQGPNLMHMPLAHLRLHSHITSSKMKRIRILRWQPQSLNPKHRATPTKLAVVSNIQCTRSNISRHTCLYLFVTRDFCQPSFVNLLSLKSFGAQEIVSCLLNFIASSFIFSQM